MMTDEKFQRIVIRAASNKSDAILRNSSLSRAIIVIKQIFQNSNDVIKIFANRLESGICEDSGYNEELKAAIEKRGVKLQLLLSDNPEEKTTIQMLKMIYPQHKEKIEVYKISKEAKEVFARYNNGEQFHFLVADGSMYRYETDIKNHRAFFSFGHKFCNVLDKAFNSAFDLSKYQPVILHK